jgi:hypothetical protein
MKLLKFFALTLIAVSVLVSVLILAVFAVSGASQTLTSAPATGIWGGLAFSYMSILVNGSSSYLICLTVVLWGIFTIAIFRDELRAVLRAILRIRISVKKDDTL